MTVVINGDTGISPVTASGTSASVDGMTVGRGGGEVSTNTAVGASSLAGSNTGTGANNAFGANALQSNTSGVENNAIGYYALNSNTSGANNEAMGSGALQLNTTGSSNTAIGHTALKSNTTASNNTAVGYQAGYSNTTGGGNSGQNTFIGDTAGYSTTSDLCTFVGRGAGSSVTSGRKNTILGTYNGNQDGLDIRTTSNYIVLSDGDGAPRLIGSNSGNWGIGGKVSTSKLYLYVNTGATADALVSQPDANATVNAYVFKNSSAGNAGYIQYNSTTTSYVTSSDYRLKENIAPMTGALAKVAQLKPVTYDWKSGGSSQGFIAHELAEVVPDCVTGEKDALDKDGNPDYQGIDTSFLVATLTAAIQELKALVDAQATEIAELKAKVA